MSCYLQQVIISDKWCPADPHVSLGRILHSQWEAQMQREPAFQSCQDSIHKAKLMAQYLNTSLMGF